MAVLPPLSFKPSPNFSTRDGQKVDLVVVHDTEGGYEGAISWLCNPQAQASAHLVLNEGGTAATLIVPWEKKAWACTNYNSVSDNIELAGFAAKTYPLQQLRAAARIVAWRLKQRGLPPKHVVPKYVGDPSAEGYTFHSDLGAAGGGHHDPGFSKTQALIFDGLVKYEYRRGGFRKLWGPEV